MYAILKIIVRLSLLVFFRKIKIKGKEKISKNGPYILISNHPSAFTDPIAVAVHIKPTIYFLAAGEYMGKGLKYWFMRRFFNMIPIYRPETMPDDTSKNSGIFQKCIEHLHSQRSILVFPEGVSQPERKVAPLKTGVARIVRATELASELKAGVEIIPIGLNYTDPHKFRSDLFMNVGDPIKASDFFTMDPDKEVEEVNALTKKMEEELIKTVLHMETSEHEDLLEKVNDTYMRDLKSSLKVKYTDQHREFELNKLTIQAFDYFQKEDPSKYEGMKNEIDDYFNLLQSHGIKDRELRKLGTRINFLQVMFFIFNFPVYLVGFIGNIIPYQVTTFLQRKFDVKETFRGSIILAVGMVMFMLWYAAIVITVWLLTPLSFFSLLLPVVLYLSGILTLIYGSTARYWMKRRRMRKYFEKHDAAKTDLLAKRAELIQKFESYRAEFDAR